ncbi:hypothetical protein ACH3XW_9765 [Acanthocheilonema viteae]
MIIHKPNLSSSHFIIDKRQSVIAIVLERRVEKKQRSQIFRWCNYNMTYLWALSHTMLLVRIKLTTRKQYKREREGQRII